MAELTKTEREFLLLMYRNNSEVMFIEHLGGFVFQFGRSDESKDTQEFMDAFNGLQDLELIKFHSGAMWRLTRDGRVLAARIEEQLGLDSNETDDEQRSPSSPSSIDPAPESKVPSEIYTQETGIQSDANSTSPTSDSSASDNPPPSSNSTQVESAEDDQNGAPSLPNPIEDAPAKQDLLGRKRLVDSLISLVADPSPERNATPLTIGLFGEWGTGKTSIMRMLADKLNRLNKKHGCGRLIIATFNAWEYQHTENIAAGLTQEVVEGLTRGLGPIRRAWIKDEFGFRRHPHEYLKTISYLPLYALLTGVVTWYLINDPSIPHHQLFGLSALVVGLGLLIRAHEKFANIVNHPIIQHRKSYLDLPSYKRHLGLIPELKNDVALLCQILVKNSNDRLVVFIDDLDRCLGNKVVKVLEAIHLVMDRRNVAVILSLDARITLTALSEHYKDLASTDIGAEVIARQYLGKIVQIPIRIEANDCSLFITHSLFHDVEDSPNTRLGTSSNVDHDFRIDLNVTDRENNNFDSNVAPSSREERTEFHECYYKSGIDNPRRLKRLRNSYRLLKALYPRQVTALNPALVLKMLFWQELLHDTNPADASNLETAEPDTFVSVARKLNMHDEEFCREMLTLRVESPTVYDGVKKMVLPVVLPRVGAYRYSNG